MIDARLETSAVKVTNLEKSATRVYQALADAGDCSASGVYEAIGPEAATLPLAGNSVYEFLQSMVERGDASFCDGRYRLTDQGLVELQKLLQAQ